MAPSDSPPPCVADAHFSVTPRTLSGKTAGIARPCDIIADVQQTGSSGDRRIREALIRSAERTQYIPPGFSEAFAGALLARHREARCREGREIEP